MRIQGIIGDFVQHGGGLRRSAAPALGGASPAMADQYAFFASSICVWVRP